MAHLLRTLEHWVHQQPVAHVAWVCTVVTVALVLLIVLPRLFRRLRVRGNRAPRRVFCFLILACVGIAVEAALDHGYRLHFGQAQATVPSVEYAQALTASTPIPTQDYHLLQMRLSREREIAGAIPELRATATWNNLADHVSFAAPLVALPADLSPTFFPGRTASAELGRAVQTWQTSIDHLPQGHVYVTRDTGAAFRIGQGSILSTRLRGQTQFLAVAGIRSSEGIVPPGPSVVMPLGAAQSLLGLSNRVSRVLIFTSRDPASDGDLRRAIVTSSPAMGDARLSPVLARYRSVRTVGQALDVSRRVTAAGLILVVLVTLCALVLGRRSLTRSQV